MRNPTGSKRVKRAFMIAKEDHEPLRGVRRCERRAIKADTRAQVDEYFEDQILAAEELSEILEEDFAWESEYEARMRDTSIVDPLERMRAANRWADEVSQSHYYENGRWIERDDPYFPEDEFHDSLARMYDEDDHYPEPDYSYLDSLLEP